jgi:tetratricopeptide (TPR) repeat protein
MTIRVPLGLRRRSRGAPATALYIPSRGAAELFSICAAMQLDPSGRVFAVAGGFVLALPEPLVGCALGAIRLTELSAGLYLPADGELVPSLLEDEAAGVVRDRGLLFLQGGRVLAFDRGAAVLMSDLLEARARPRRGWSSLPEPNGLAERLTHIELERPDPEPEELYREIRKAMNHPDRRSSPTQGEEGDPLPLAGDSQGLGEDSDLDGERGEAGGASAGERGRPSPRNIRELAAAVRDWARRLRQARAKPEGAPPEQKNAGRTDHERQERATGGSADGSGSLAGAVGGILQPLGEAISALREKLQWEWVDHSSLLSKLVREFREGDKALALRRAIPIMRPGDGLTPQIPVRANWLPWRRAVYSLSELLRRPGPVRGEAIPIRMARDQVIRELMEEYRKAAEQALKQGDFRRAAYIYGVLLQDDRLAASALARGGLHHDAAILYATKLNDRAAAAQAFEAAGEFDRALELYKQLGQHERAGDLLRRIGEEEAAVALYLAAANELATRSVNHLGAGRLLLEKARRVDLAIEQFQTGWDKRPAGNSTQCGLELARLHSQAGDIDKFRRVLDQADAMFDSPGFPFDSHVYSEIVRMAGGRALETIAEEVRDRALQATARALGRGLLNRRAMGTMVSKWLGRSKLWPAALLSDADFAVAAAALEPRHETVQPRDHVEIQRLQVGRGSVTAVCQAAVSSEIFLGFESGLICVFQPENNQVVELPTDYGAVVAISVDPQGQALAAVYDARHGLSLCCFSKRPDGNYLARPEISLDPTELIWLTPILPIGVQRLVGVGDGTSVTVCDVASGLPLQRLRLSGVGAARPGAGHLLAVGPRATFSARDVTVLTHDASDWVVLDTSNERSVPTGCKWRPGETGAHGLRCAPISWRYAAPVLEMVGVDHNGAVRAAEFYSDGGTLQLIASRVAANEAGYIGATHAGSNTVVAVSPLGIDWLSFSGDRFRLSHQWQRAEVGFSSAVACFATHSRDAVVIGSRGLVMRVPLPGRGSGGKKR